MSHVEVALLVEVSIAHVCTVDIIAHSLSIVLNVPSEMVFGLASLLANIHLSVAIVLLVFIFQFAVENVMADAHENVLEDILYVVEFDYCAVREFNILPTSDFKIN